MNETFGKVIVAKSPRWDVEAQWDDKAGPSLQAQIDAEFEQSAKPYAGSSGWVCTLTIECGTLVCACR
ncbi:hypothetical protein [Polyangium jinanense]|uniref:Uncharacterized protein n=1 Tax=Polyangium jinanense TaxID=2829994 RepID=A0A9X4ATG6_9BACT|nr:hypothetical protein [Polyangium jinanense]MDC3955539.1 hypothetical protein [Polyangium jinanense]MDC3982175.1 hypothetical protein [Polyangium jinanense]